MLDPSNRVHIEVRAEVRCKSQQGAYKVRWSANATEHHRLRA